MESSDGEDGVQGVDVSDELQDTFSASALMKQIESLLVINEAPVPGYVSELCPVCYEFTI